MTALFGTFEFSVNTGGWILTPFGLVLIIILVLFYELIWKAGASE
jgi:hypothetical protein